MSIFDPVGAEETLHQGFRSVREQPGYEAARWMIEDVFAHFDDLDGNFIEQFLTNGFDQRIFELSLFAYFLRSGFTLHREHAVPDFIISVDDFRVAVEATTVNPPTAGIVAELGSAIADLSDAEMVEYKRHEFPSGLGVRSSPSWGSGIGSLSSAGRYHWCWRSRRFTTTRPWACQTLRCRPTSTE